MRKVVMSACVMACAVSGMFFAGAAPACAEETALNNKAFSFFGVGTEFIGYREHATVPGGRSLDLSLNYTNPVQRSGGYIPLFKDHGLYLESSATLKSVAAGEEWKAQGLGTIQQDDSKVNWNEVSLAVARHLSPGHQVTVGFDYYSLRFTRFNFQSAEGTDAFNATVPNPLNPDHLTYSQWTAQGKDGRTYPGLRPENNLNTVIEDFSCLTAMVGYRYDTFFVHPESPWRFSAGVRAGLPLYYQAENSQLPGLSFVGSVNKGYDLGADAALAWKYNQHFSVMGRADYNYKHRSSMTDGDSSVPENTLNSLQTTIALAWAF